MLLAIRWADGPLGVDELELTQLNTRTKVVHATKKANSHGWSGWRQAGMSLIDLGTTTKVANLHG